MFETSTHRGCIYIDQQSYELIDRKGASHDHDRRHRHVDVPRGKLRRRGGRRPHSGPDHAELTSAHAEESGSIRAKVPSHTPPVPISPLLAAFASLVPVEG